jgi:hypothetical protein
MYIYVPTRMPDHFTFFLFILGAVDRLDPAPFENFWFTNSANVILLIASYNQITQTMQIPLSYADAILGPKGSNIALIRRSSGATLSMQETRGLPEEITVEIKGTSSQVQTAQHMIQVGTSLDLHFKLKKESIATLAQNY